MKKRRRIHDAWYVLIACCAIQAGALGAISNCKGVFYDAICTSLGISLGTFTLQGVFAGIASAAATPLALRLLNKHRMHYVLFAACLGYGGTQFIMSFFGVNMALWYSAAIIQAIAGAFLLFLPVPIVLNRWFSKRKGLATAVAAAFSGISGMILNPIYAAIIEAFDWRLGYRFAAVLSVVLVGPAVLLFLRGSPEEKGLRPYGAEDGDERARAAAKPRADIDRNGWMMIGCMAIIAICLSCGSCFQSHLTKYGITIGLPLRISAILPSAAMFGSVILKPTMGFCSDRFGVNRSAYLFFSLNIAGFLMLLLSGYAEMWLYAGALFCGISMAGNVVLFPLLIEHNLHDYNFDQCYGYLSMIISMAGVAAGAMFGYIFDWYGSYVPCFVLLAIIAVSGLAALYGVTIIFKTGKNTFNCM